MAHGSPSPEGTAAYLAFSRLLWSRYPQQNVFLGAVEGLPGKAEAFAAVKQANPAAVVLMPFMFVAGETCGQGYVGGRPRELEIRASAAKSLSRRRD